MIERQVEHVTRLLKRMRLRREAWLDVRQRVVERYNRRLQARLEANPAWNAPGCRNYYRHASGKIVTQWPDRTLRYWLETRRLDLFAYESGHLPTRTIRREATGRPPAADGQAVLG